MLKRQLLEIGLSEYEASVYSFLLENGHSTAQKLYTGTGINRVTTYNILEGLIKKGLVSSVDTDKKKVFHAEPPTRLHDFLEKQKHLRDEERKKIENQQKRLQQVMPGFEVLFNSIGEKPKVRFLEGVEALRYVRQELLRGMKDGDVPFYEIFSEDITRELEKQLGTDLSVEDRKIFDQLKKYKGQIIYTYSKERLPDKFFSSMHERFFVPSSKFSILSDIALCGDQISILSLTNGKFSTVLIENKDIAETLRTLFRLAIEHARTQKV